MTDNFSYDTYLSPFTTRYGSSEMRYIWSEENRRLLWRRIWVSLARAEYKAGLVSKKELDDLIKHQKNIDILKAHEIEKDIYHELMAEIQTFSGQAKIGGGKIHLGATSTDILDNATMLQIHDSLKIIQDKLKILLRVFSDKISSNLDEICMGYTHLQPAEPTTIAYRFAFYAQDLLCDERLLERVGDLLKGKGIKGAVGTSASFKHLLKENSLDSSLLETIVMKELNLPFVDISSQTYPRKFDFLAVVILCSIAQSLHKFCFDYRVLQAAPYGEWMEKRSSKRVGSSAMPFKRNPDKAEKVCSLARLVSSFLPVAWSNPALSLLERTLDDSANQRVFLPESFLAIDECLDTTIELLENLEINHGAVKKNLDTYGLFSATEPLLMELVRKGANRQKMHEKIKTISMQAWAEIQNNKANPLVRLLATDHEIKKLINSSELKNLMDPSLHIGLAKKRSKEFLRELKEVI